MKTSDFQDLKVWQKAMDMAVETYAMLNTFPKEERFGLCDQIRRCAISIPSNIAEGHHRNSDKDFIRFLCISRGSVAELQTQLLLSKRVGYVLEETFIALYSQLVEIDKMLTGLINFLNSRHSTNH